MSDLVDQLAALGPFFAVETHDATSAPRDPWRRMSELVSDPEILMSRVLAVRARLAVAGGQPPEAVELRVAASVTQLGLVARLISPVVGAAVISGQPLELELHTTWWQPTLGGPFPVSVPLTFDTSATHLFGGPIRDLVDATTPLSVSPQVLWGNVASAVNGAATMIVSSQPAYTDRTREITSLLLGQPPLRGTSSATTGPGFRRRSCCLIYRAAAPDAKGAVCGDCGLADPPPDSDGRSREGHRGETAEHHRDRGR